MIWRAARTTAGRACDRTTYRTAARHPWPREANLPYRGTWRHKLRSEIDKAETEALKKLAAHLLALTPQALDKAEHAGELIEVDCDAKD